MDHIGGNVTSENYTAKFGESFLKHSYLHQDVNILGNSLSAALGGSEKSRAAQNNQMNLESYCESCHFQAYE